MAKGLTKFLFVIAAILLMGSLVALLIPAKELAQNLANLAYSFLLLGAIKEILDFFRNGKK